MIDNREFFREINKIHLTPVTIRRIFLLLVRLHYSNSSNYGPLAKQMAPYLWNAEAGKCTLPIELDYTYDATNMDKKPAIYVGLDDIEYKRVVLDNHVGYTYDTAGQHLVKTASTKIIVRHIGSSPEEALALENLTCQFLLGIQPIIRDTLPQVMEYDVVGSKSSRPFEKNSQQAQQRFISDTIVAFSYSAAWMVQFESHRIKTISWQQCLAECGKSN